MTMENRKNLTKIERRITKLEEKIFEMKRTSGKSNQKGVTMSNYKKKIILLMEEIEENEEIINRIRERNTKLSCY